MSTYLNRTQPCTRSGCNARRFADTDRCFDHQRGRGLFVAWFLFCAVVALAVLGLGAWAVIEIVQWVTAQ